MTSMIPARAASAAATDMATVHPGGWSFRCAASAGDFEAALRREHQVFVAAPPSSLQPSHLLALIEATVLTVRRCVHSPGLLNMELAGATLPGSDGEEGVSLSLVVTFEPGEAWRQGEYDRRRGDRRDGVNPKPTVKEELR